MSIHQNRWGFYPVSKATFLQLKTLYKRTFEAERNIARLGRWEAKTVNRQGPAPTVCPHLSLDQPCYVKRSRHGQEFLKRYPMTLLADEIRNAYQSARMPRKTAEEVPTIPLTDVQIANRYAKVEAWYNQPKEEFEHASV